MGLLKDVQYANVEFRVLVLLLLDGDQNGDQRLGRCAQYVQNNNNCWLKTSEKVGPKIVGSSIRRTVLKMRLIGQSQT
jgi:hypothetical protein